MKDKTKEKLLLISAISPFPKDSGGAVRIYNTINNLATHFDIYLLYFKKSDYEITNKDKEFLSKFTKQSYSLNIKNEKSNKSFLLNFQPYWFSEWYNEELKIAIYNIINENDIKIVQVEFSQLAYLINYIPSYVKRIFTSHDISTISFKRRLLELRNNKTKIIHFFRWLEIYIYEKYYLPKFDIVCTVSKDDEYSLKKIFNIKEVITVPNGIEENITLFKKSNLSIINLGYIGSFSHPPNKYAFEYFVNKIAPLLEKKHIKFKYYLAGKNNSDEIQKTINDSNLCEKTQIIDLGFVNSTKDFFQKIDILITPIFSGSGSRIKILEALAHGVPVVSTKIGAEGIHIKSKLLLIANKEIEFIKQVKQLKEVLKSNNYLIYKESLQEEIKPYLWKNIFNCYAKKLLK